MVYGHCFPERALATIRPFCFAIPFHHVERAVFRCCVSANLFHPHYSTLIDTFFCDRMYIPVLELAAHLHAETLTHAGEHGLLVGSTDVGEGVSLG